MSNQTQILSRSTYHRWLAGFCLLLAYLSPTKFPGLSGWLGAGGFLLLSAVAFTTPKLVSDPKSLPPLKLILAVVSLLLIVASVVVWSIER